VGNIAVIGSLNMDIVNHVLKMPLPGETIKALSTEYIPGGKGANQAVAASLSGSRVKMIGAVGSDLFSNKLIESLNEHGVQTDTLVNKKCETGVAFITVDHTGENNIILSEGANGLFSERDIPFSLFDDVDTLLVQNEIPWHATRFAIETANKNGIRVIFNPAPALRSKAIIPLVDVLILNKTELEVLTGSIVKDISSAELGLKDLITDGVREVVLTLGDQGSIYMNSGGKHLYTPAYKVNTVDTTAAGDTFIGAFASIYEADLSIEEKLLYSTAAAALSVSKKRAQTSIPNREDIEQFIAQQM